MRLKSKRKWANKKNKLVSLVNFRAIVTFRRILKERILT
jgi:hypothetical protein